jgi:hypothetical protein
MPNLSTVFRSKWFNRVADWIIQTVAGAWVLLALVGLVFLLVTTIKGEDAWAQTVLYGDPGPEQEQLQAWIDSSHVATPSVPVRLYRGNCEQDRSGGFPAERVEVEGAEASDVQTCAALTSPNATPDSANEAVYFPHMSWHPQYPARWWHLNLLNELGHVYDEVIGDRDRHRERFAAIFDYSAKEWWPVNAAAALNTQWEKWSMAFAFCATGTPFATASRLIATGEYSGFGFDPTRGQYQQTCALLAHLTP